jgi:hypothetical protein
MTSLRKMKKAGATSMRNAQKMDAERKGGKPMRAEVKKRAITEKNKRSQRVLKGPSIPAREAAGDKKARPGFNANTKGMTAQMTKNSSLKAKRSGPVSSPVAKKK